MFLSPTKQTIEWFAKLIVKVSVGNNTVMSPETVAIINDYLEINENISWKR